MPCSLSRATISHIFLIDGSAVSLNHETASEPQSLVENGDKADGRSAMHRHPQGSPVDRGRVAPYREDAAPR